LNHLALTLTRYLGHGAFPLAEPEREDLRTSVVTWRRDFDEDGQITVRQHRIMNRWFLDAGLDFHPAAALLASVDNTLYDALGIP
jgi:hypothetical protein